MGYPDPDGTRAQETKATHIVFRLPPLLSGVLATTNGGEAAPAWMANPSSQK